MEPAQTLRLLDIFVLGIPILSISVLLVIKTRAIKNMQRLYNVQMVIFRNVLIVGYLLLALGLFLVSADISEWFGYEFIEDLADTTWHAVALMVLVAVTWSFYDYHRILAQSDQSV